jgi:hypothetical protein
MKCNLVNWERVLPVLLGSPTSALTHTNSVRAATFTIQRLHLLAQATSAGSTSGWWYAL